MEGPAKKRRTENYSSEEINVLLDCVEKKKHIIENKKTDAVTWKQKDQVWELIASTFNSSSTNGRTGKQLRSKFEALKRDARKMAATERQCRLQTGGGPLPELKPNFVLEKVRQLIQLSVEGLPSEFDSDTIPDPVREQNEDEGNSYVSYEFPEESSEVITVEMDVPVISNEEFLNLTSSDAGDGPAVLSAANTEADNSWTNYSPAMLKQPKSKPLRDALVEANSPSLNHPASTSRPRHRLSKSGRNVENWAAEKANLATLQQTLLKQQFANRERREQEAHESDMKVKKAQLLSLRLDVAIKRESLKQSKQN